LNKGHRKVFLVVGYLVPALFVVSLISFFPVTYAIYVSLHKTLYLNIGSFVGLKNYARILRSPDILNSVRVSFMYVFSSLVLTIPLSLSMALLLNRAGKSVNIFRVTVLLPWVFSQTTAGLLWTWLLNTSYGPVNYVLFKWGLGKINFFGSIDRALLSVITVNVWWSYPLPTLFFLASLQSIPKDLYEVAKIDGASGVACFTHVTLPFLLNTLLAVLIILTMLYFNMVTLIFVLTGGGPLATTETLSFRIFLETLFNVRIDRATALSVMLFGFNLLFTALYAILLRREALY
jgi:multiple sugar transport system permease protein